MFSFSAVAALWQRGLAVKRFEFSRASFHRKFVSNLLYDAKPSALTTSIMVVEQQVGQNAMPKLRAFVSCLDNFVL